MMKILKGKNTKPVCSIIFMAFALVMTSCDSSEVKPYIDEPDTPVEDTFKIFQMRIDVENGSQIVSKETYLNCTIDIDGKKIFGNYHGKGRIRGRGNSSWLWYDKKPYRIKLDEKSEILGLKSEKDWVLLANYRDPTDLMNAFGFEVADWLGLPYSNHSRYIEVTLNGSYIGLYQLTEQVEQGSNRVDIDNNEGILISLDVDDGPYYCPNAKDNFWSKIYEMPVCVKYPEDPTSDQLASIKNDFAKLETAIKSADYDSVFVLLDIKSFINYLILQEFVYNVEVDAPRSIFMFKDKEGKYTMGPAWDFDAGFDFDWSSMYTGHSYFNAQELVFGTDPVNHTNGYNVPAFFVDMFRNRRFMEEYKSRWNSVKDSILEHSWNIMEENVDFIQYALARDYQKWPIDKYFDSEIRQMYYWLSNRVIYLNYVINNYPVPVN